MCACGVNAFELNKYRQHVQSPRYIHKYETNIKSDIILASVFILALPGRVHIFTGCEEDSNKYDKKCFIKKITNKNYSDVC